ncbi:MAG: PAS domain S-box protein [Mongoliitalea sp.]
MSSTPLSSLEKKRLEVLYSYGILDSEDDEDYRSITELASEICETPISLITFVDESRQWFKSNTGLTIKETPREYSFCSHAILTPDQVSIFRDLKNDPRFADNPYVKKDGGFAFYTGVPIISEEKQPLGTLCVLDYQPRKLTEKQVTQLKKLSRQVEKLLKLRKAKRELSIYQESLEKQLAYNKSLFETIPDVLMIFDYDGNILEIKSGKNEDLLLNPQELTSKNIREVLPVNVLELFIKKLQKIKKGLPFNLLEYKLKTIKGIQTFEANFARFEEDKVLALIRNITKSKALEEELFRTKDILLEAGKMAKVGAWEVDFVNNRHLWSEVTKEILELGDGPIPSVEDGIKLYKNDPEGLERLTKAFNKAIYEGISYDLELKVETIRGNEKWVRTIGKPIFDNGNCVGVFGTFQDITEIKFKEEELIHKSAEYEHLFDNMNQGVVYQDESGHIFRANSAAENILGLSMDQMIGRTSIDPRWHAIRWDGSAYPGDQHPAMVALATGESVIGEIMGVYSPEKNTYKWILIDSLPEYKRNSSEKPYRVLSTFTDITQLIQIESKLKENEANLTSIIESTNESIWSIDRDYTIVYANKTFKELFKLTFDKEVKEKVNVLDLLPAEVSQFWTSQYQQAFEGNTCSFDFDIQQGEQIRNYEVNIRPIKVDDTIIGASIFAKDNTNTKAYILEIEEQNRKLREIAWKQSHLVRAPLARIIGLSSIIHELIIQEKNGLNEQDEFQTLLTHLNTSTKELDDIIRSIVEISSPFKYEF